MRYNHFLPILVALVLTSSAISTARGQNLPLENLPLIGGTGGASFSRACPDNQVLTGVRARVGAVIDALGIKCRAVQANGSLGGENDFGSLAGGSGGVLSSGSCPPGSVIAGQGGIPMGIGLQAFALSCKAWSAANRRWTNTTAGTIQVLAGAAALQTGILVLVGGSPSVVSASRICAQQTQPVVTLRGRSGTIIDAAGLSCNEP